MIHEAYVDRVAPIVDVAVGRSARSRQSVREDGDEALGFGVFNDALLRAIHIRGIAAAAVQREEQRDGCARLVTVRHIDGDLTLNLADQHGNYRKCSSRLSGRKGPRLTLRCGHRETDDDQREQTGQQTRMICNSKHDNSSLSPGRTAPTNGRGSIFLVIEIAQGARSTSLGDEYVIHSDFRCASGLSPAPALRS